MNQDKIKMREKLSFAMANFGNIPIMTLINGYLLIFYTNICGLSPAACATLFLIARFLDAINDPLVGFIIDHLPTRKMGHFRPTLILGTILCSVNFLLLWFGPMLSTSGKLAIAYVSYILLGVLFPVMDISLNSLLPVMTEDMKERNSLSTIKGLAYVIGALVIGVAAPLILGDTSNKQGYINLVLIMTAVIFFFSIIGTMGVKERVKPQMENSYSVKELFKILSQKPVYITFLAVLLYSIGSNIVNAANTYFYTYIFEDLTLASIITLITCVAVFPATMVIGNLIGRFGKKKMYAIGLALAGLAPIIRLLDVRSIPLLIVSVLIAGIGAGFAAPLNYGIQADNTDYIEVSMGIRAEGAVASLSSFVSKCAMGIGGAIPGYLLQLAGFDSKAAVQNDDVINVIVLCVLILPAIVNVVAIVIFSKGYPITKEKLNEQTYLLREKRSKAGTSE
ncbi:MULTISPECIES: glycoside-pentoside-hexuronide (GPH):cation symporter [Clostridia]|uniref:MFS transporter n=1 Tax=Clostridia TaxID=186801 RepID=UPI0008230289|nr:MULTISPECIES: glycoside-pentoside-hexuronide (GPH):cation symporter [Clostridia]MCU6776065.1 glycoside-pentoside-hexuronide (GPH):cation symporter [Blautia acetigignens]RGF71594.1 MFS transporter [Ruminococcus sp. AF31-8BH]SCH99818.1 Glucuronide permease [uncultured Blautia sp.]